MRLILLLSALLSSTVAWAEVPAPGVLAAELVDVVGDRADLDEDEAVEALERLLARDADTYAKLAVAVERYEEAPEVHGETIRRAIVHLRMRQHRVERLAEHAESRAAQEARRAEILALAEEHAGASRKEQARIEDELRVRIAEALALRREEAVRRIAEASERLERAKAELAELEARESELVEEYLEKALSHDRQ